MTALKAAMRLPEMAQQISEFEPVAPIGVPPSDSEASTRLAVIADTAA